MRARPSPTPQCPMRRPLRVLVGGALLIIASGLSIALVACSGSSPGVFTLRTDGLKFTETELQATAGQPITVTVLNGDGYAHAFDLDEAEVHVPLPAGQNQTVTFTLSEPGTYRFYCGIGGHEAAGMVGTLTVVAP